VGYRLIAPVTLPDAVVSVPLRPARALEHRAAKLNRGIVLALLGGILLTGLAGFALWQSRRDVAFEMDGFLTLHARLGTERASSPSPDGRLIAVVEEREEEGQFDLYLKPEGSDAAFRLTDTSEKERSPTWSRDGRAIGFVQTTATTCSLNIIPATGGAVQRLSGCEPGLSYQLKWSEDNAWLALVEFCPLRKPARITMVPVNAPSRRPRPSSLLLMLR
jgi:dipeptidyl aminopeptidase/acylaminoacyl peptidase